MNSQRSVSVCTSVCVCGHLHNGWPLEEKFRREVLQENVLDKA